MSYQSFNALAACKCASFATYDMRRGYEVNELMQAQGSVYGARDVIMDLRQRLDRVERERIGQP